jgi:NADPH:quinone reductase
MKAITVDQPGGRPTLAEVPAPTPGARQVLVRVRASSVNSLDAGIAAGRFHDMGMPHEFPVILGRDVAGTVEAVGDGVTSVSPGDRVFGEIPFTPPIHVGTWAELVVVGEENLVRTPDGVDDTVAGAASLAATTAIMVVDALKLSAGDTVLVVGAAGGVGSIAVQLAAAAGATVLAPGLPEDEAYLRGLGVTEVLDRADVTTAVRTRYPDGVDAIAVLVPVGGTGVSDAALADGGRVASATYAAGEGPGRTDVVHVPTTDVLTRVADHLADGTITIPVQRTWRLDDAAEALQAFQTSHTQGKLALTVDSERSE